MAKRLIIVGRGATAERLMELGGQLGYAEMSLSDVIPEDLCDEDHLVIAEEDHALGRKLLVQAALASQLPEYLGFAAPHREGWKALVHLASEGVAKERIDAVSAPAGVDVGAETPEEVAIAVAAELVAVKRGKSRPSAGLAIPVRRRARVEASPRRLIGAFGRPAPSDGDDGDGSDKGRN
jgi:xanthine dehydrogenase accessory factor